jgi:hypothetical protein
MRQIEIHIAPLTRGACATLTSLSTGSLIVSWHYAVEIENPARWFGAGVAVRWP